MKNIGYSLPEPEYETFLDYLRKNGFEDICKLFETLADGLPEKGGCNGPFLEMGEDGDLYLSMMFFGRKSSEDGTNEFLWKTSVSEKVSGDDEVAEVSQRLVKKVLERFPETRTKVEMLLEIRGLCSSVEK